MGIKQPTSSAMMMDCARKRTFLEIDGKGDGNDEATPKGSGGAVQWVERKKEASKGRTREEKRGWRGKKGAPSRIFFLPCVIGPSGGYQEETAAKWESS